jgi:peptidoglycan/LPS O-acetylase OafA/YrhL
VGTLRLLLALTVLNWHYQIVPFNFLYSYSAVYVFLMISGFYISLVLDQRYGTTFGGTLTFYGNRLLRLLPACWIVLLICFVFMPTAPIHWNDFLLIPRAFLKFESVTDGGLFLGQMYTVTLELMFYAIAPLIVLRGLPWLIGAFAAAASYIAVTWWLALDPEIWQYRSFAGALPYFFAGALAYRLYLLAAKWDPAPRLVYAAVSLMAIVGWFSRSRFAVWTDDAMIFAFYAVTALAIPFLFIASKDSRSDRLIGDLSYPLYIVHVPAAWLIIHYYPDRTAGSAALVFCLSLSAAALLTFAIDRPIDSLRRRISNQFLARRRDNVAAIANLVPQVE